MTKFAKLDCLTEATSGWTNAASLLHRWHSRAQCALPTRAEPKPKPKSKPKRSIRGESDKIERKRRSQLLVEPPAPLDLAGAQKENRNKFTQSSSPQTSTRRFGLAEREEISEIEQQIESIESRLQANHQNSSPDRSSKFATTLDRTMALRGAHEASACKKAGARDERTRRKGELATLLTILFGFLAISQLSPAVCLQASSPSSTAATNTTNIITTNTMNQRTGPPSRLAPANDTKLAESVAALAPLRANNATEEPLEEVAEGAGEEEKEAGGGYEGAKEKKEETSGALDSSRTKLGELVNELAGSGADLLVDRLRGSASREESEEEEGAGEDDGGKESKEEEGGGAKTAKSPQSLRDEQLKFAFDTYARWRGTGDDLIELVSRKVMPLIVEHGYDVDPATAGGLLQVFNAIRGLRPWALKLLDASAKLTPGLLAGTQSDFGDFDQCLAIRVDDPNNLAASNPDFPNQLDPQTGLKSTTLVGRYCLADVQFPKPPREPLARANATSGGLLQATLRSSHMPIDNQWAPIELRKPLLDFAHSPAYRDTIFVETGNFLHMLYVDPVRVGVCLTNKIDPQAFAEVLNKLLADFRITIDFRGRCVTKYERPEWTQYQRWSAYILAAFCLLVALSTCLELLLTRLDEHNNTICSSHHHNHHLLSPKFKPEFSSSARKLQRTTNSWLLSDNLAALRRRELLTSFSLVRNTKRLFKVAKERRPSSGGDFGGEKAWRNCETKGPSGGADCSVESSPSIERRTSSSIDGGSAVELILNDAIGKISGSGLGAASGNCALPAAGDEALHKRPSISSSSSLTSGAGVSLERGQPTGASNWCGPNLQCLHGVRVLTMTWMIVNHTYMFGGFFVLWAYRRLIDIADWPKSLSFQLVLNGWLTVETYFFLSALIIVLTVMPLMKSSKFNYAAYVLHRLIRLLPAYVGLVCLNFLWPLVSSGPVWLVKGKSFVQSPCENYLWTNFLFVNNWIWPEKQVGSRASLHLSGSNHDQRAIGQLKQRSLARSLARFQFNEPKLLRAQQKCARLLTNERKNNNSTASSAYPMAAQCMVHTWFLSADFQLYLLAPAVVYLLYR